MAEYLGCGDNSCLIEKPTGQATNGGCRCYSELSLHRRRKLTKAIRGFKERADTVPALEECIANLLAAFAPHVHTPRLERPEITAAMLKARELVGFGN